MTYFEILGVDEEAPEGAVRRAFAQFAAAFHADAWRTAGTETRRMAAIVFRAGNEAYRVLVHGALRQAYVDRLGRGERRVPHDEIAGSSSSRISVVPPAPSSASPDSARRSEPPIRPVIVSKETK
jgi:DnaJ-class molecular chaperone